MLIDWFTVGAQALNFLILVWLMKRFLYQPILNAVDAREKRIAASLADAAAREADAKNDRESLRQKNEDFDRQRAALLAKAVEEAATERQRLLGEARKAADALSARREATLANDARNLGKALSRRTQDEVFAIARKTLADLAGASLEQHMCDAFIARLKAMPDEAKRAFAAALGSTTNATADAVLVRSAFALPAAQQQAIQTAIRHGFATELEVRFETAPDLISGIEVTAKGQKIAWSISEYLALLEQSTRELLHVNDGQGVSPEPAPPVSRGGPPQPAPQ